MQNGDIFSRLMAWWPLQTGAGEVPQILVPQTNPLVIAPSATGSTTIELSADCWLQFDDWVYWSSNTAFPDVSGFRVAVYWGSREWSLMNAQVRGELIFGTAQLPGRIGYRPWAVTKPGGGRAILQFDFTNLNTTTLTIEIALRGHRRGVR